MCVLGMQAQRGDHGEFVPRGRRAGEEGTDLWGRAVGASADESGPSGVACACRGWLAGPGWRERKSAGRRGEESAGPRVWAARGGGLGCCAWGKLGRARRAGARVGPNGEGNLG